ncbi:tyrosine-protein phosphatase [Deinococcus sp.]|uniref:tyrosine-protein phosphatase n=1 Tax=Deinococcus sp. TaxID=47478 RepID=UPI003C7C27CD
MPKTIPWDAALNARHALPGLIRSGNLSFLSGQGRRELLASGVSRIIDLRNRAEREIDPAPFAGRPEYLNLPLVPYRNQALDHASADARSNADFYRAYLDHAGNQLAAVFGAMHDSPPGPSLVHCHAGKDRTGLVVALAQELCGVPREQIAADYAESDQHLGQFYAGQLKRKPDPAKRMRLAWFQVSRPEDMVATLEHLDAGLGGVSACLGAFGFGLSEQEKLAERLLSSARG